MKEELKKSMQLQKCKGVVMDVREEEVWKQIKLENSG